MGGTIAARREMVERLESGRPHGRPRKRWKDNVKENMRELGHEGENWIGLAQEREQWRTYVEGIKDMHVQQPVRPGHGGTPTTDARTRALTQITTHVELLSF